MKTKIAISLFVLGVLGAAAEREKSLIKTTRLSATEIGIHCLNGADPTGKKFGDTLIISCGK